MSLVITVARSVKGWRRVINNDPQNSRGVKRGRRGPAGVYEEIDDDHCRSLGEGADGLLRKTRGLVPELNRYFVTVTEHESKNAEILVCQVL